MKPTLTPRELEVLRLASEGQTSETMGKTLGIGKRTVDFHLGNIYTKLDVAIRLQAYRKAQEWGLVCAISTSATN